MGRKTISIKGEAYARLKAARRYPTGLFSQVALQAARPEGTATAEAFLRLLRRNRVHFTDDETARIEELRQADAPPEDKWTRQT